MTELPGGLTWEAFSRRLARAQTPHSAWTVLPVATGAELLPVVRRAATPLDGPGRSLRIEVVNLGSERGRLRIEVFGGGGEKVGSNLPPKAPFVLPGERMTVPAKLTGRQWDALLSGGHLLISPGSLPEPYRTFRFERDPFAEHATLAWPVPAFHAAHAAPLEPGATAPGERARGAVRTLLPWCEVPAAPPEVRERIWTFTNPGSAAVRGRLATRPPEVLEVVPETLDLPPEGQRSVLLRLDQAWLATHEEDRLEVDVVLEREGDGRQAGSRQRILAVVLERHPLQWPAVRPVPSRDLPVALEAEEGERGGWLVRLPLTNLGERPARIFLRFENGERSATVEIAPRGDTTEATFAIDGRLGQQIGEAGMLATLDSDDEVVWDPCIIEHDIHLAFPHKDDLLIEPGDLKWDVIPAGTDLADATLVLEHQKSRRHAVTVGQLTIYRDGHPAEPTGFPHQQVSPGGKLPLVSKRLRVRRRIVLEAEVDLSNGMLKRVERRSITIWREGDEIKYLEKELPKPKPRTRRPFLLPALLALVVVVAGLVLWRRTADPQVPPPAAADQPRAMTTPPAELPRPPDDPPRQTPPSVLDTPQPPPPQRKEAAATGVLNVNANPWAEIWVDGERHETTPAVLTLPAGRHTVVLRFPGPPAKEWTRRVNVRPGETVDLSPDW